MTIRQTLVLIYCWIGIPWVNYAQGNTAFYQKKYHSRNEIGIRGGLNYSTPTVTAYYVSSSIPTAILWGVRPKTGFYLGSSYSQDLSPERLLLRVDATIQMKGVKSVDLTGKSILNASYYYIGLSPQIGLHITHKITVYTGLEANLLVAKQNSWGSGSSIEIGTVLRGAYTIGQFRVETGYFRGFNRYDRLSDFAAIGGAFRHDFYNQNWQVGLVYNWNR